MTEGFLENGFIIDLSNAKDTSEIVQELSEILGIKEAQGKNICLKLGKVKLNQSQLLSIKSLIDSMDSELAFIDTKAAKTEEAANALGIVVSELSNEIEVQEIEEYEYDEEELEEDEDLESNEKDSYELITNKPLSQEQLPEIEEIEAEQLEELKEVVDEEFEAEAESDEDEEDELDEISEEEGKTEISKLSTLYIQQNLRSGQTMSYDGNVVLIGDTNPGSEIIARGDITVWGVIGGIAHAGARGNKYAKIRALKLNAIQLRISGYYARRPDTVNIPYIQRSSQFVPEQASVSDRAIIIQKMNEI